MNIAFFGSSLVSSYWNGAATYYRGMVHALYRRGHRITFFEPDIFERQQNRDIEDPEWATVRVYPAHDEGPVLQALEEASEADLIIKASNVGAFDDLLEGAVLDLQASHRLVAFWDVDAPATLDRVQKDPADPLHTLVPRYDLVFTYGGGNPVVEAYRKLGARGCVPIYNALDPEVHIPVPANDRYNSDLAFLGNRLPDRESRVDEFFFEAARQLPNKRFLLGGAGWTDRWMPENVRYLGHVPTQDHNSLNCTPTAVLNINRESVARYGFSPPTRVFEAAGAGACLITDHCEGIEFFLEPDREVLVARNGGEVADQLDRLTWDRANRIGFAAHRRVRDQHTYAHRAKQFEQALDGMVRLQEAFP